MKLNTTWRSLSENSDENMTLSDGGGDDVDNDDVCVLYLKYNNKNMTHDDDGVDRDDDDDNAMCCSLSEYSDENMMDPYNLAICFGPTLLPIPPDRDQVSYQASVNEIIKTIIVHQEEIFPNDGGESYEKCILENSRCEQMKCWCKKKKKKKRK